jgi:ABC-2 type transport system permease protein
MTSPTSYCKLPSKALFFINVKRFIWLSVLNILGLLLFIPFIILNQGPGRIARLLEDPVYMENWIGQNWFNSIAFNPMVMLMLIAVALLWAAMLYNYLNETRSVTFFHSLPFNRRSLYWNLNIAGAVGMLIPIVITALVCLLIRFIGSFGMLYQAWDVFNWFLTYFIMELVFFSSAVFVGMVTGLPMVQPIFTLIMHGLPAALYGLTAIVLHQTIYGFPNYTSQMKWADNLPIVRLFIEPLFGVSERGYVGFIYLGIMLLLIIAFLLIGLWLYGRRPMERTGDIIVFPVLRPVFKYGVTYCAMLSGALLISEILNQYLQPWMLILWSIVGYCLAEMLLQKTVRILRAWKGLAAYLIILLLCMGGISADIIGYQRKIPEQNQIAAVYINGDSKTYEAVQAFDKLTDMGIRILPQWVDQLDPRLCFQDEGNIEAMRQVHQALIDKKDDKKDPYSRWRNQKVTYVLKNGRQLVRQYNLNLIDYPDLAKEIYESAEYRKYRRNISFAKSEDLHFLRLSNNQRLGAEIELFTAQEIDGLLQALKADITTEPFESMEGEGEYFIRLEYRYKLPEMDWSAMQNIAPKVFNQELREQMQRAYELRQDQDIKYAKYDSYNTIGITVNYNNTIQWLKANGYWEKLQPDPKNFTEVRLYESYNIPGSLQDEKYYWERNYIERESYEIAYDRPTTEAVAVEEMQAGSRSNEFIAIMDPAVIEAIIKDDTYKPYFRAYGEAVKDKKIYCLDFYDDRQDYVFTGYYYEGLPGFLKDEAAAIPSISE